jgi:hypothetical protein
MHYLIGMCLLVTLHNITFSYRIITNFQKVLILFIVQLQKEDALDKDVVIFEYNLCLAIDLNQVFDVVVFVQERLLAEVKFVYGAAHADEFALKLDVQLILLICLLLPGRLTPLMAMLISSSLHEHARYHVFDVRSRFSHVLLLDFAQSLGALFFVLYLVLIEIKTDAKDLLLTTDLLCSQSLLEFKNYRGARVVDEGGLDADVNKVLSLLQLSFNLLFKVVVEIQMVPLT